MEGESRVNRTLYVGGLDEAVTTQLLQAAFIPFGPLKDVQIPMDNASQKNRGFGFVEFEEEGDAADAIENMNNSELCGRIIRVGTARPQSKKLGNKPVWEAEADEFWAKLKEDTAEGTADAPAEPLAPVAGKRSTGSK